MLLKNFCFLFLIIFLSGFPLLSLGANIIPGEIPGYEKLGLPQSPVESSTGLVQKLGQFIKIVYITFFTVAVFYILFAAYKLLTSHDKPEDVNQARTALVYASIAIAVALLSVSFEAIINNFLTGNKIIPPNEETYGHFNQ